MRRTSLLVLAGLALVIALAVWLTRDPRPAAPHATSTSATLPHRARPPAAVLDAAAPAEPGARIDGDVVGPDGAPVSGAEVRARCRGATTRAMTGGDGRFELGDLPPGRCVVSASSEGDESEIRTLELAGGARTTARFALALTSVRGQVLDPEGQPVAAAQVVSVAVERDVDPRVAVATTDAQGHFTLGRLGPGAHRLWAGWPGTPSEALMARDPQATVARGARDVRLRLAPPGSIVGTVTVAGQPAGRYRLLITPSSSGVAMSDEPVEVPTGRFTRSEVPPGDWRVTVHGDGLIARSVEATVHAGAVTDLGTIDLEPGVTVRGQVLAADGAPVAHASVSLVADRPEQHRSVTERFAATDDAGGFVLPGIPVPRAPLVLELWAGHDGNDARATVTLAPGQTSLPPVTLRVGRPAISRP